MNYRFPSMIVLLIFVILVVCGPEREQVEISVSRSFKEAIEEAAPTQEYCFYALKESYPKNIEEMTKAKLFVCGEVKTNADLGVVMASLDDFDIPLFTSIHRFYINPNVISGAWTMSEDISITLESGDVAKIPREKSGYGKENSMETLVEKCVEEMRKDAKSVLLMNRSIKHDVLDQMVEIVFKE